MGIIVQKYGGTSVESIDKIKKVAQKVAEKKLRGHKIVVVVSAMGDTTDNLINMAYDITDSPDKRELDALMATGEMVSSSLLAIALKALGHDAVSYTAYQVPINTTGAYGKSTILGIDEKKIMESLDNNQIVVIAGFQGIDKSGNITTLGRGGSDTTAVALAAKLEGACEIYTDVEGIYTVDPKLYKYAKKLDVISFEEMLELASLGTNVINSKAVEMGERFNIPIYVAHYEKVVKGTYIKEVEFMENKPVTGIAISDSDVIITLESVHSTLNTLANIFESIADQRISVDMISQTAPTNGNVNISFTIPKGDLELCKSVLNKVLPGISIKVDEDITKFSVVGTGMKSTFGVASRLFKLLSENNIQVKMVTTSEIRITCAISHADKLNAVQIAAKEFGL